MSYVADLHIHSRFSRACSPQLNIPNLAQWGGYKGIQLLGTGDFLHPLWLTELKSQLKEDGSGFMSHKGSDIKFVLTVEIASIYSHKGSGRRIHNLVFLPSFEAADKFQKALLGKHANIASDGRPIVGVSSKDLLSMALEASGKAIFIPAHAWTPWFGVFGSESGYGSLEECFEDMSDYIYGVETGLSSDPAMNWRISELDNRSILSFSDAHSLPNLGREATVFNEDFSEGYDGLLKTIKNQSVAGTIEFYPEEGKYHYTGHRNCGIKYSPEETKAKGTKCPVCGKGLTVGVMERVEEVATRSSEELGVQNEGGIIKCTIFPDRPEYRMLVPLNQVIAESLNTAKTSKKIEDEYKKLVTNLGGEIKVLTQVPLEEITKIAGPKIAEGVGKVRSGDLVIDPGYDGVYGVVKIWNGEATEEQKPEAPQLGLFDEW